MKHLKLFENRGDKFWIVVYEHFEDASSNFQSLFDDRESAENYYIELIHDISDKQPYCDWEIKNDVNKYNL